MSATGQPQAGNHESVIALPWHCAASRGSWLPGQPPAL